MTLCFEAQIRLGRGQCGLITRVMNPDTQRCLQPHGCWGPGNGWQLILADLVRSTYLWKLAPVLSPTFPRYQFAIWPDTDIIRDWPPAPAPTCELILGMARPDKQNYNNNTPDDNEDHHHQCPLTIGHPDITGMRAVETQRRNLLYVLNLGLDIFGFRIFYDMRLLSPALARRGEMWGEHGVTRQMPTNITFTDNFCFLSKVLRNTSQDFGHWPGYQVYKPRYITIRGLPQQTLTPPLHIFQTIVRDLINYPLDTDAILCY